MSQLIGDNGQDIINILVRYRNIFVDRIICLWMWIYESFNLFALYTSQDIWNKFHFWLCYIKSRLILDHREKKKLLEWVRDNIASNRRQSEASRRFSECFYDNATDFSSCWRDGILLCALIEALVPGSCPRYDLLNSEHKWDNVRLALKLIEKKIGIKPEITAEDIIKCSPKNEKKIGCLLAQIKVASTKLKVRPIINRPDDEDDVVFDVEQECLARGMGLSVAVIGRQARFNIFLKSISNLNIVIEIKGKSGSLCSERITNRSPKRKNSTELETIERRKTSQKHIRNIPFEYEVLPGKIRVGYIPIEDGQHRLSIIWQGQHIMGSPYMVNVDNTASSEDSINVKKQKKFLKIEDCYNNEMKNNDSGQGNTEKIFRPKFGTVTKKRVLRHIMKINGKEVVVEADSDDVITLLGKLTKETSPEENNENSINKLTHECNLKNNEFMAHYPSSSKNKIVSSPPNLTTVLEGIDQTDSDLLFHNIKSRKLSSKAAINVSLDKKECNLLEWNGSPTKIENASKINENLVITETRQEIISKEPNKCLQINKLEHLDDNHFSHKSNDSFLDCLSEVNSRISELSNKVDLNNESDFKLDLIKFERSPLKTETFCNDGLKDIEKQYEKKEFNKISNKDLQFVENIAHEKIEKYPNDTYIKPSKKEEDCTHNEEKSKTSELQKYETVEENQFYCLPILHESKQNTILTKHNSKVSTIDFQNDFHTEKNTTKIVSISPKQTTIDSNKKIHQPIRKINYHKLFKSTKHEGSLVKNKVQEWERAMNKISNSEIKETLTDDSTDSSILVSVRSRKQFWENGCQIADMEELHPYSESDYGERNGDVTRTKSPDYLASINTTYPLRVNKTTLDKSTQVSLDDFDKLNAIKRKNDYPSETPDSEDSGICDYQRSITSINNRNNSPSAYRHNCYPNNHLFPAQESVYSDLTDAASVSTDWDRGFIDDEIPDYANLLLDNYVSFTGLLNTEKPITRRQLIKHDFFDDEEEFLKESSTPKAERCRIFGTGIYYGQVCLRNHFQVRTKGAGPGYLSVNIQGAGKHDVSEITIIYSGNELYDILYEVSQPGYYIISIKWGDLNIPESPYICKITY